MKVEYIDHMGSDHTVLNAARASFNKQKDVGAEITDKDKSLLLFLARGYDQQSWEATKAKLANIRPINSGLDRLEEIMWELRTKAVHFAPFTHPQISVRITAPLAIARQLWKAHIGAVGGDVGYAAYSEESRRYIDAAPTYWLPEKWRKRSEYAKQGSSNEEIEDAELDKGIQRLFNWITKAYTEMVNDAKVAPELARFVLPAATEVTWTWTGSLMFFARVCHQRLDKDAQQEAGMIAQQISDLIAPLYPYSWQALTKGRIED